MIDKAVVKLFEKAGEIGSQPNLLKKVQERFCRLPYNDFATPFMDAVMSVIVAETTIQCVTVNNMIKFAANSLTGLSNLSSENNRSGLYLISDFIRLCRNYGHVHNKVIRWRFCLFLNHLLNHMSEGTILPEELCNVATSILLNRLKDKKPEVRTQAAHALNRLQEPDNPSCKIVEHFLLHMTRDPSAEVRTAIVKEIAMFSKVIDNMLETTIIDVSDHVRKEVFNRLLSHPFNCFSSKQRQIILEKGLKDENSNIKSLVTKRLLSNWLEVCNDDYVVFLKHINVENESICEKTLNIMFESYYDSQVLELANSFLNADSRMIDFDQLTVEKIFLWKCVAKYLTKEKKIELARQQGHFDDDYIEVLLPDLVLFSDYIREYYFKYDVEGDKTFILTQLLDMAKTFYIDDVGAESLNKLCVDITLDCKMSLKPVKSIVLLLNLTNKNGEDILIFVKQVLNEIQAQTNDLYCLINKVGKKELLDYHKDTTSKTIDKLLNNQSPDLNKINLLLEKKKMIKSQLNELNISTEELSQVDIATKYLSKVFELIYQIQQLPKASRERSLLTDIIVNFVVRHLDCSKVSLRMDAIRCLAPYMLADNVTVAKEHMVTLCSEIANPLSNRHLVFEIMFELFLRYDVNTFDISDNLDIEEEYQELFSVDNILPLLVNSIDYDVDDKSFKSVVIEGFCNLLIFKKVKSINLLSKLLIIWFRRVSTETYKIYSQLVKFITSYVFYIRSSSSTLAKCYVPLLKEIDEFDLVDKLDIKLIEVNSTLTNLTRGLLFKNSKFALNAHDELASYILDYLLDENQPYTAMLVDTLCKLDIYFEKDDFIKTIGPKLMRAIKHIKNMDDKNKAKYLKKINLKFDPVLQKKSSFIRRNLKTKVDNIVTNIDMIPSCNNQVSNPIVEAYSDMSQDSHKPDVYNDLSQETSNVEIHSDLFSQEIVPKTLSSDDEDEHPQLDAIKRMSEVFKRSFNAKIVDDSILISSDSD